LQSLLRLLFEQYPRPLGFKIEKDTLKIYPMGSAP
jgi:hypothetical protein